MDAKINTAWNKLAAELQSLPPSWPSKLVFLNTPTTHSSQFVVAENTIRPNEGLCSLDIRDPDTGHFLKIQTFVACNIELYQNFDTPRAQEFVRELHNVADGFESIKREHWEKGRRTYCIGTPSKCYWGISNLNLQMQIIQIRSKPHCHQLR